jgi:hypothetical protein
MSQLDYQRMTLEAVEASIQATKTTRQALEAVAEMMKMTLQKMEAEAAQPAEVQAAEGPATELLVPPAPAPKVWSVHDCHTHCVGKDKGLWARGAVANGSYGVCVGPTPKVKDTANMKINGPLGEVTVSKRRWNNAKGIAIGDTLYMGDTVLHKVFQGKVVAQPINGPFTSVSAKEESFLFSLNSARDQEKMAREIELVFKVEWAEIAELNETWEAYLGTSRRISVSPLTAAPPA